MQPTGSLVCCLAVLLGLAGCTRFQPQPLSPAQQADALESRSLTNAALKSFLEKHLQREWPQGPAGPWDFEMLTLAALYYQPNLEVARAQWAVAQGGQTTASQRPNPSLNVTPGYDTTTAVPSPWIPLGFLDVPIETAGKRGYRRAQAAHLAEAARLNLVTVAWQIRGQLRASLLELAGATQRNALLQQQLTLQQQVVRLLDQQVQTGAIASAEALPLRITLARVEFDLAEAQRLEAEARARVAGALGVPTRALDSIQLSFGWLTSTDAVGRLTSTEARRIALQSRPDILGSLADYAAAQSALQLEIAKQYPDVRLSPGYQYDQGDSKWTLGLTAELPVLHQNQGPIAEAKGRRAEAAARFTALQAKVLANLEQALQSVRASENSTARLRVLAEQQAKRRDAVTAQYRAGATDQLDYLNAQLESVTTELVQLEGQLKLQQAVGALEEAVQPLPKWAPAIFESQQNPAR